MTWFWLDFAQTNVQTNSTAQTPLPEPLSRHTQFHSAKAPASATRQNEFSDEKESELLKNSENLSCKKIARLLATVAPKPLPPDKETPLDAEHTLLTITIDAETPELLAQVKVHLSHGIPR